MGRRKKQNNIDSNFEEKTEVHMTTIETANDAEALESLESEMDRVRVELEQAKRDLAEKKEELNNLPKNEKKAELSSSPAIKVEDKALSEKLAAQRISDNELLTGIFHNLRVPGQTVKLPYYKHVGDPEKWYTLVHGKTYTIPRGFANQINGGTDEDPCYFMPKFTKKTGEAAIIIDPDNPESSIHSVDTSHKKFMFSPVGFG